MKNNSLFLILFLVLVFGAAYIHFNSPLSRALMKMEPFGIAVASDKPAYLKYFPRQKKAIISFINAKNLKGKKISGAEIINFFGENAARENVYIALAAEGGADNFIAPQWRERPSIVFDRLKTYLHARKEGKTDINFLDFAVILTRILILNACDILIGYGETADKNSLSVGASGKETDYPVSFELLNGSSQSAAAQKFTQYFRDVSDNKNLKMDIKYFGNNAELLKDTRIMDYSGKFVEISYIAKKAGLKNFPITAGERKMGYTDGAIIIGENFPFHLINEE